MKQCPICSKIYDDSWDVCIQDRGKLTKMTDKQQDNLKTMLATTTYNIEGKKIKEYLGIVNGISITGFGAFREFLAGFTDALGGRSGSYHNEYKKAKDLALSLLKQEAIKLSANAVVGIRLDFENISAKGKSMVMVTATGTAVKYE